MSQRHTQTETSVQSENSLNYISLKKITVQQIKEYNTTLKVLYIYFCSSSALILLLWLPSGGSSPAQNGFWSLCWKRSRTTSPETAAGHSITAKPQVPKTPHRRTALEVYRTVTAWRHPSRATILNKKRSTCEHKWKKQTNHSNKTRKNKTCVKRKIGLLSC